MTYEEILAEISRELARKFSSPDDPGLFERRQRLAVLFGMVPDDRAAELRLQLGDRPTSDPLSKQFHGRISTPTRRQMLGILDAKDGATGPDDSDEPVSTVEDEPSEPALVSPLDPLPDDAEPRWREASDSLQEALAQTADPRGERYACWLSALDAGADDRVIEWRRICPSTSGAIGAAAIVGPCELSGFNLDQTELEATIDSASSVEAADGQLSIFTHLRSRIVQDHELTAAPVENLRDVHDQVQLAIRNLDIWANSPIPIDGADRAMPRAYIALHDWIAAQQRDTDSIYSCF